MASTETGTSWENLNYIGDLITADPTRTPLLSAIGGMTGGGLRTLNHEFPISAEYSLTAAAQTAIDEDAELSAPSYSDISLTQYKNVVETHYLGVEATYSALADFRGRLSGINTANTEPDMDDLLAFKIDIRLKEIARNMEYSILRGSYQASTDADVANKSRGLTECASNASNTVAAGSADLSEDMIKELIRTMLGNGAQFGMPVIVTGAFQVQQISKLYGYAPTDRTYGGVALKTILLDLAGEVGVMYDPQAATDTILIVDMAALAPVWQSIPDKPDGIFYEEHGRTSASITGQLYGKMGLYHGPYFLHGSITGLATS